MIDTCSCQERADVDNVDNEMIKTFQAWNGTVCEEENVGAELGAELS